MQTTISKWGNSLALGLPRHLADEAQLVEGATVNVEVEGGIVKVTPSRKRFERPGFFKAMRPPASLIGASR